MVDTVVEGVLFSPDNHTISPNELGITLGAETSARKNGTVGGQMTKRLVELGEKTIQNEVFPKK